MQSKTSCFNGAVFRRTLARWWPIWAGAALIMFFMLPFRLATIQTDAWYGDMTAAEAVYQSAFGATTGMPLLTCLFGLVFAAATFDFLFSKRGAELMSALPITRTGMFCTRFLAGLTMLLTAGLLAAGLAAALTLSKGQRDLTAVLSWLGVYSAEAVTFYCIGVFCAMLTGQLLVLPCLYLLVNIGGEVLNVTLQRMARLLLTGIPNNTPVAAFNWLSALSPCAELIIATGARYAYFYGGVGQTTDAFLGWRTVLIYLAAGLALAVLSLLLFRRRRMELTQEPVTLRGLGTVLKYLVTVLCAFGLPAVVLQLFGVSRLTSMAGLIGSTALGAAIGYLVSEMILRKSVRIRARGWLGVLLVTIAACLVVGAMKLDAFGYVRHVPDPAEVERAEITAFSRLDSTLTDPDAIRTLTDLHRDLIEVQEPSIFSGWDLQITYHLKNGRTMSRAYYMPDSGDSDSFPKRAYRLAALGEIFDRSLQPLHPLTPQVTEYVFVEWSEPATGEENASVYTGSYMERQLTEKEWTSLYENGILPDLEAGAFPHVGEHVEVLPSGAMVEVHLRWPEEGTQELLYCITPEATHTLAWLESHGFDLPGME